MDRVGFEPTTSAAAAQLALLIQLCRGNAVQTLVGTTVPLILPSAD